MSFIVFVLRANQQQIISLWLEYLFIHQLGLLSSQTLEIIADEILLITYKSPLILNIHPPTQIIIIIVDEIHLTNHL
jgi:hypothetical protein